MCKKIMTLVLGLTLVAAAAYAETRGVRPETLELFDGIIDREADFDPDLCDSDTLDQIPMNPAGLENDWECTDASTVGAGGDITAVMDCTTGACVSLNPANGAKIDFGNNVNSATEGLFLPGNATDCSAAIAVKQVCYDVDDTTLYVGNGTNPIKISPPDVDLVANEFTGIQSSPGGEEWEIGPTGYGEFLLYLQADEFRGRPNEPVNLGDSDNDYIEFEDDSGEFGYYDDGAFVLPELGAAPGDTANYGQFMNMNDTPVFVQEGGNELDVAIELLAHFGGAVDADDECLYYSQYQSMASTTPACAGVAAASSWVIPQNMYITHIRTVIRVASNAGYGCIIQPKVGGSNAGTASTLGIDAVAFTHDTTVQNLSVASGAILEFQALDGEGAEVCDNGTNPQLIVEVWGYWIN